MNSAASCCFRSTLTLFLIMFSRCHAALHHTYTHVIQQLERMALCTQTIAFIAALFLAVTWTVFADRRRQFFVRMLLYTSCGLSCALMFAWFNPGSRDRHDRFCSTNATSRVQDDSGYCTAQGFFIQVCTNPLHCL
jgi:hypothetical protein